MNNTDNNINSETSEQTERTRFETVGENGGPINPETGREYTNMEIVNLVIVALTYGRANIHISDPVISASWRALDNTFQNGYDKGFKAGHRAGLSEAGVGNESEEIVVWRKI